MHADGLSMYLHMLPCHTISVEQLAFLHTNYHATYPRPACPPQEHCQLSGFRFLAALLEDIPVTLHMRSCAVQLDGFVLVVSVKPSVLAQPSSSTSRSKGPSSKRGGLWKGSRGSDVLMQGCFLGRSELLCLQTAGAGAGGGHQYRTEDALEAVPGFHVEQPAASPEQALGSWSSSSGGAITVSSIGRPSGRCAGKQLWLEAAVHFIARIADTFTDRTVAFAAERHMAIHVATAHLILEIMDRDPSGVGKGLSQQQQKAASFDVLTLLGCSPGDAQQALALARHQRREEDEEEGEAGASNSSSSSCEGTTTSGLDASGSKGHSPGLQPLHAPQGHAVVGEVGAAGVGPSSAAARPSSAGWQGSGAGTAGTGTGGGASGTGTCPTAAPAAAHR